jgi:NitT/TauT family transport system ATP-binding protein
MNSRVSFSEAKSTAIALSHVSKIYANGTVALQDMSLEIEDGQFVSLVGASGCGKSTALRLIAGLGQMSEGNITWGHHQPQKELAFVFQEPSLLPWATVMENVRLPLKLIGMSDRESRSPVQEALHLVGLDSFAQSYPRELSGGMKMRVSIARALVTKPKILLMDEPFGALDEMTRAKLNADVLNLWQQGDGKGDRYTVVFVTHNIYEAVYLSQRVVIMAPRPGRVVGEVAIEAPYPRTEEFRTSRISNEYCREISGRLAAAVAGTEYYDEQINSR